MYQAMNAVTALSIHRGYIFRMQIHALLAQKNRWHMRQDYESAAATPFSLTAVCCTVMV